MSNENKTLQKSTSTYNVSFTCDVEKDLDLLVPGGSSDLPVPLGALVGLHAAVLLRLGEVPAARGKARIKVGVILGALRTPAVAPTPWC